MYELWSRQCPPPIVSALAIPIPNTTALHFISTSLCTEYGCTGIPCLKTTAYTCVYCRHDPSDDVCMFSVRTWRPCVQCCPPFLSMQEFFSYGAVSLVTSFFSCFSSSGSLSRTTVADSTGAMTQVSALGLLQADTIWFYVLSNIIVCSCVHAL